MTGGRIAVIAVLLVLLSIGVFSFALTAPEVRVPPDLFRAYEA